MLEPAGGVAREGLPPVIGVFGVTGGGAMVPTQWAVACSCKVANWIKLLDRTKHGMVRVAVPILGVQGGEEGSQGNPKGVRPWSLLVRQYPPA